ncbi:type VI secretion system domain-containing protein [Citrobacter sp. RHB25-C09]|nr:type VI secretion system domain-containing protein [Citrobacter sp. RHB25-C09]
MPGDSKRLTYTLWLEGILSFVNSRISQPLSTRQAELPSLTLCATGICLAPVTAVADNLWLNQLAEITTLSPESKQSSNELPLPEVLLPYLPRRHGISRLMQDARLAGGACFIFLALAMLASFINNQRLIRSVGDHLAVYEHLSGTPPLPKQQAQQRLRADSLLLDDWQRRGEPLRYGLGLYQGGRLIPPVEAAINGWISGHHLMKSIRHDTIHQLPPLSADGRTRIDPPKPEQRALLKRLYLQQSWQELLEQAAEMFSRGANHLWLDLQWYIHQALLKSRKEAEAAIIQNDLKGLLSRLAGLEELAFSDGSPYADEVTLNWIHQQVLDENAGWREEHTASTAGDNDILHLEAEALAIADNDGADAAINWLQSRPGTSNSRNRWLLRLLMSRIAEQTGNNELAHHLLSELGAHACTLPLAEWEPELIFEVKARHLRLLRMKAGRNESDKTRLQPEMDRLLAELITIDPARAAVLCG